MISIDTILANSKDSAINIKHRIKAHCILQVLDKPEFILIKRAWRIQIPNLLAIVNDDPEVKEMVCIDNLLETIDRDVIQA